MKPSTIARYRRIRAERNRLLGRMPVMKMYARLAETFELSVEQIRKILAKKHPP